MTFENCTDVLTNYEIHLYEEERSRNTIQKYTRDIKSLLQFIGERELTKSELLLYKEHLKRNYAPSSVNSMIAAINSFLDWIGLATLKLKASKIQKNIFTAPERELSYDEYTRLIEAAEHKENRKLSLLIQTICATGIRVSELQFITVSALHAQRAIVECKGKTRVVFLPKALCKILKQYCKKQNIHTGSIFITKTGKPIDRSNIWKMMKRLCKDAKVAESRVFPHNLRHLFARTYYTIEKDISRLADILGHSSINTTRIYTMETGNIHAEHLNQMALVYRRQ